MGFYIETEGDKSKVDILRDEHRAEVVAKPQSFEDIPEDKALICVVDNGGFEAAGYCFSPREFQAFADPDGRPKTWLLMDKAKAAELSGYSKRSTRF